MNCEVPKFVMLENMLDEHGRWGSIAVNAAYVRSVTDQGCVPGTVRMRTLDASIVVVGTVQSVAAALGFVAHLPPGAMTTTDQDTVIPIAPDGYPFPRGAEPPPDSTPPLSTPEAKACLSREHTRRPSREVIENVLTALPPAQLALVMADTSGMPPEERPYACLVRACECNFLDWKTLKQ